MQVFASILKCTELRDIICTKMNVLCKISKKTRVLNRLNAGWSEPVDLVRLCRMIPRLSPFVLIFSACNFCVRDLSNTTLWQYSGILDNTLREMHFVCSCFTKIYVYFCDITRLRFFLATQNLNVVIPGFWMRIIKEAFIEIFLVVFCC